MAKKKTEHVDAWEEPDSAPVEDEGAEQSIAEYIPELRRQAGEALSEALQAEEDAIDKAIANGVTGDDQSETVIITADDLLKPDPAEPAYAVTFRLPLSVLAALLDANSPLASVFGADHYGLISAGELTPIGELVKAGFDQTAVGHKMATAWRIAHNADLQPKKG